MSAAAEEDDCFRRLTYHHLADPDPGRWLAAADRCEELGGDLRLARTWRRRALWYDPVWRLAKMLSGSGVSKGSRDECDLPSLAAAAAPGAVLYRVAMARTASMLCVQTCHVLRWRQEEVDRATPGGGRFSFLAREEVVVGIHAGDRALLWKIRCPQAREDLGRYLTRKAVELADALGLHEEQDVGDRW